MYQLHVERASAVPLVTAASTTAPTVPVLRDGRLERAPNALEGETAAFFPLIITQKTLQERRDKVVFEALASQLVGSEAAWLRSAADKGTGAWLRNDSTGVGTSNRRLGSPAFADNLRIWLALPLFNEEVRVCHCGDQFESHPTTAKHHAFNCPGTSNLRLARHDAVRDLLASYVSVLVGKEGVVSREKIFPVGDGGTSKKMDVYVVVGAQWFGVDISVTNPGSADGLAAGSAKVGGKAAAAKEVFKRGQWSKTLSPTQLQHNFVPFVVETGGRLGRDAWSFLDKVASLERLCDLPDERVARLRRQFLRSLNAAIADSNATIAQVFRRNCGVALPRRAVNADAEDFAMTNGMTPRHSRQPGEGGENSSPSSPLPSVQQEDAGGADPAVFQQDGSSVAAAVGTGVSSDVTGQEAVTRTPQSPALAQPSIWTHLQRNDYSALRLGLETMEDKARAGRALAGCADISVVAAIAEERSGPLTRGFGLQAKQAIPSGQLLGLFVGVVRVRQEAAVPPSYSLPFTPVVNGRNKGARTLLDATEAGNALRFINHSCDPNCVATVEWDEEGFPQLPIRVCRPIRKGEFLSVDYGEDLKRFFMCGCAACDGAEPAAPQLCYVCYTDGSLQACKAGGAVAGWGAVVVERRMQADKQSGKAIFAFHGPVESSASSIFWLGARIHTNNTGELSAIGEALLWFRDYAACPPFLFLTVYTDSQYCIDAISGGRAGTNSNTELINGIKALYESLAGQVELVKVAAHSGDRWNDEADRLAALGAQGKCCLPGRFSLTVEPAVCQRSVIRAPAPTIQSAASASTPDIRSVITSEGVRWICENLVWSAVEWSSADKLLTVKVRPPVRANSDECTVAGVWDNRLADAVFAALTDTADVEEAAERLSDILRAGDMQLFRLLRRFDPSELEANSPLTQSDGLCGYRMEYQASLRHEHVADSTVSWEDPKLEDAEARASFLTWLEVRLSTAAHTLSASGRGTCWRITIC